MIDSLLANQILLSQRKKTDKLSSVGETAGTIDKQWFSVRQLAAAAVPKEEDLEAQLSW